MPKIMRNNNVEYMVPPAGTLLILCQLLLVNMTGFAGGGGDPFSFENSGCRIYQGLQSVEV